MKQNKIKYEKRKSKKRGRLFIVYMNNKKYRNNVNTGIFTMIMYKCMEITKRGMNTVSR